MSQKRLKTWQKATALVPLALLSGAWTTSLALTSTATAAPKDAPVALPDGTAIPTEAIEAPASLSEPGEIAPAVPADSARSVIASASTNGIPSAALSAYQRAAQVLGSADASCKVGWQLIAAIGRVESDHGRYGGNTLGNDGKSRPGIYGIPLDGSNGTARITDTDAGQYDNDQVYDRAVGPMQFIPSTWSVVGVDGDGDGVRDPQDVDDAALASAVYLCSGDEDLSTYGGQKAAVYRYNHSSDYVDLVISIMNAYVGGDYASVPNGTAAPTVFTPVADEPSARAPRGQKAAGPKQSGDRGNGGGAAAPGRGSTGDGAGSDSGSGGTGGSPVGGDGDSSGPAEETTKSPVETVTETVTKAPETVTETLTALDKARISCQSSFSAAELNLLGGLESCAQQVLNGGLGAVQNTLGGLLGGDGEKKGDGLLGGVLGN